MCPFNRSLYKAFVLQLLYMETVLVNFRIRKDILLEIDKIVKEGLYSNKSELFKEAIRKVIEEHKTKHLISELKKKQGEGKRLGINEPTEEEFEKIREDVWNQLHSHNSSGVT